MRKCYRCDREGHVISACRWTSEACFKYGSKEHMLKDCPKVVVNCFKCDEAGQHGGRVCKKEYGAII